MPGTEQPPAPPEPSESVSAPLVSSEQPDVFASPDDYGDDKPFEVIKLPIKSKLVRVRQLDTPEIVSLSMLPDLAGVAELSRRLLAPDDDDDPLPPDFSIETLLVDNYSYLGHVVHRAVLASDDLRIVHCGSCSAQGGVSIKHPRSLWTLRQARRLHPDDMDAISSIALRVAAMRLVRPFSQAQPGSDTPESASHGESTPE